jgi:hypothetical protein
MSARADKHRKTAGGVEKQVTNTVFCLMKTFTRRENGRWSRPAAAPFSGLYRDGGPAFSPDGNKIFFCSRRPLEKGTDRMHDNDIWYVERTPDGWSEPVNCRVPVNTADARKAFPFVAPD